jgi:hypothetical protein
MTDNSVAGASAGAWTPDMPMLASATYTQMVERRMYLADTRRGDDPLVVDCDWAREYAEARIVEVVEWSRHGMVPDPLMGT